MKNFSKFYVIFVPLLLIGIFFVAQMARADNGGGGGGGAGPFCGSSPTPGTLVSIPSSKIITLSPGWNIISTPNVLSSHQFSVAETSANFDIFLLDPTAASGWQTMQGEGQTEFTPLFAYFINNKTGTSQTLTLNNNLNLSPAQRLFQRTLQPGWNGIGIALPDSTMQWAHQNPYSGGVAQILNQVNQSTLLTIDFTANQSDPNSVGISSDWNVKTSLGANDVSSLQDLKGYGAYITQATSSLIGYENLSETQYTLTYTAGSNGSITGNASQTVYAGLNGTTVTAVPAAGYQFAGWSGTDCSTQNPRTDTGVQSNINVTANFGTSAVATFGTNAVVAANVNAGTTGFTFWSAPLQVGTRAVLLETANFRMIGSASTNALSNIRMFINGIDTGKIATITSINGSTYATFDFTSAPITLTTGLDTIDVRADIVGGASRTIQFSIQQASDLTIADSQAGTNIAVGGTIPNSAGTISIASGSATVVVDPTFASQTNISAGATNAVIGRFIVHSYGEDVKVSTLNVLPVLTGMTPMASGLNNVTLYFNGSQVGSQQSWTSGTLTFQLGSQLIAPAGQDSTLEVRADLQTNGNLAYTAGTVSVTLPAETSNAQGQGSQTTIGVPSSDVSTNGLAIQSAQLVVAKNSAFADQSVNPNSAGAKIGSYVIQNQSTSESIRLTQLQIAMVGTVSISDLSALRTSDTTGSGSTPIQPGINNTFSVNDILAPGASMTLDIFTNTGSSTSGIIQTTLIVSSIGTVDNISTTSAVITGQVMTLGTGQIQIPTLVMSSTTPAQYIATSVPSGAVNASQATFNFVSTSGASTINELRFTVTDSASNSSVTNVCIGTVCEQPVSGVADLTGLSLAVPNGGGGYTANVQVSYAGVGTGGLTPGTTSSIALTYVKYQSGGTTTVMSPTPNVAAPIMTLVGSVPTVTVSSTNNSGLILGGQNQIGQVTVAANPQGAIKVNQIVFDIQYSGFTSSTITGTPFLALGGSSTPITGSSCRVNDYEIVCTLGSGYSSDFIISAGQSQTFNLYAQVNGTAQSGITANVSSSLINGGFDWDDTSTNGASGIGLNSFLIYNFPTNSYTIHN